MLPRDQYLGVRRPRVALLCIGNEVIDGRITNTNAPWLSQKLIEEGFLPTFVSSCRDCKEEICHVLTFLAERSNYIITSGGLGPTTDDITREALADFTNQKLILNEEELGRLKNRFRSRGRKYESANSIQAYFPKEARVIPNSLGTAPGFITKSTGGIPIYSLPGVPAELRGMVEETVMFDLKEQEGDSLLSPSSMLFQVFGISEAEAGKVISRLPIPETVSIGYRPHFPELEVRLETIGEKKDLLEAHTIIQERLSEFIYSEEQGGSLPKTIHTLLTLQKKTLCVAESCTGGYLGKFLTDEPGASSFFLGGAITYSNAMKEQLLGVSAETLKQHGAVSPEVAIAMASGARDRFGSDIAISITGIAGPDGGSKEKPVGLFYIGVASTGHQKTLKFLMPTNREYVRRYAAYAALDTIRRFLLGLGYLK